MRIKIGQRYLRTEFTGHKGTICSSIIVEVLSDNKNINDEYDCQVVQIISGTMYSIGRIKSCALRDLSIINYSYLEGQDSP